jgi:hypothetical protein
MRTQNLFKVLATIVAMLCLSGVLSAQAYITSNYYTKMTYSPAADGSFRDSTVGVADPNYTEYVTVGSVMPYAIRQDLNIGALIASNIYNPSVFFVAIGLGTATPVTTSAADAAWTQAAYTIRDTTNGGGALSKITIGGTPALNSLAAPAQALAPFTLDSVYAVNWLTTGTRHIWMYEWPISRTAGIGACAGDSSSLAVTVQPKPRVDWSDNNTAADGSPWIKQACGNPNNLVLVDYSGFDAVRVVYDSTYTNLNGVTSLAGRDSTDFAGSFATANTANNQTLTSWYCFQDKSGATIAPRYGYVTYQIYYVTDPIARKSLKRNVALYGSVATAVNTDVLATGGDLLANANMPSHNYRVYALPTPTARPIKHITNTGW